jgi:hypothetical protein
MSNRQVAFFFLTSILMVYSIEALLSKVYSTRVQAVVKREKSAFFSTNTGAEGSTTIKGCKIERVANSLTTFTITIDGEEAELGKFSESIYKKLIKDAKELRFQGFRPGTIPPHIEPTYRAFAMDECAREATLEAMQQNQINPFDGAREDFMIENVSIPPPPPQKRSKKSKKGEKNAAQEAESPIENAKTWITFTNMKGAIDAGWRPGQSFSFVARNVKGQLLDQGNKSLLTSNVAMPIVEGDADDIDLDQVRANIIKNSSDRFLETK